MWSTLSLRSFHSFTFETVPVFVWSTMALSPPFNKCRVVLPLATDLPKFSSLRLSHQGDLRAQVVIQASQHFRPFETQAACYGCFSCQSVCSVFFFFFFFIFFSSFFFFFPLSLSPSLCQCATETDAHKSFG